MAEDNGVAHSPHVGSADAARRSEEVDEQIILFLRAVSRHKDGATRKSLPLADRAQDKARQKARKLKLVYYYDSRWIITAAGQSTLNRAARSAVEQPPSCEDANPNTKSAPPLSDGEGK